MADLDRNRGVGRDGYSALRSGRIGPDGNRTFHCHFASVKVAGGVGMTVDYLARLGDFERRDPDLECLVGNPDMVKAAAELVDMSAKVRSGRTAERVLIKMTIELPAEMTRDQRQAVAERLVEDQVIAGRIPIAAVHANGQVQPHIHLAATARPVNLTTCTVDRRSENRWLVGKAAVRAERAKVAKIVNEVLGTELFHPGRLIDTGIHRPAQKRVPQRLWHRLGIKDVEADAVAEVACRRAAERAEAAKKRQEAHEKRLLKAIELPEIKNLMKARKDVEAWGRSLERENQELKARKPAERPTDELPATPKQLKTLFELATQKAAKIEADPEVPWPRGTVGQWIRELKTWPDAPAPEEVEDDQLAKLREAVERETNLRRKAIQDMSTMAVEIGELKRRLAQVQQLQPDPPPQSSPAPQPGRPQVTRKPQNREENER